MCDIVDYMYKLITNYLFINFYWVLILSIVIDYSYMYFIRVQVNMCDISRKRKAYCKKDMGYSKDFSNLTVIANMFPVKNFFI